MGLFFEEFHLILLFVWLQYADRLPIGLEKVIRTVPPEIVKQFYRKWYHLHNMAVIAVGDFSDTQVKHFSVSIALRTWSYIFF